MVTLHLLLLGCGGGPTHATDSVRPETGETAHGETGDTAGETADTTDTVETGPPPDDADGDGHNRLEVGGDDCDDADALVYPGAQEWCDDVDQDCDGAPLATGVCALIQPLESQAYAFNPDDVDYAIAVRDVTGDGLDDVLGSNFDASVGIAAGTGGIAGLAAWDWSPVWSPTWECPRQTPGLDVGDIDGDGYNDVAIEAPDCLYGFVIAWGPIDASSTKLTEWEGPESYYFPTRARVADVNADGASDLLRAPIMDGEGVLEVFFGGGRTVALGMVTGPDTDAFMVENVGDVTGDGIADLVRAAGRATPRWLATETLTAGATLDEADLDGGDLLDPEAVSAPEGPAPAWLAVGDWSGDGLDDVVLVQTESNPVECGWVLFYDSFPVGDVYASAVVANDVVHDEDGWCRFGRDTGILRHDDVPVGILVDIGGASPSQVVLPSDWPAPGTYALSEVRHLEMADYTNAGNIANSQFFAWGRGDLDGDGWSDVLGAALGPDGYYWQTIMKPFDDVPWDEPEYW